jgi:hypothetical protein
MGQRPGLLIRIVLCSAGALQHVKRELVEERLQRSIHIPHLSWGVAPGYGEAGPLGRFSGILDFLEWTQLLTPNA